MQTSPLEPPSYEECTITDSRPPLLTIDIKDTRIYNRANTTRPVHYKTTSNLNRDFVKGGFALLRVDHPCKPTERTEIYDIRAVGDARFRITSSLAAPGPGRVVTCERKFGFSGHWWEVRQVGGGGHGSRREEEAGEVKVLVAKRTSREDGTLRWCDGRGRLLATDTKLVRGRGNHENGFHMPVLEIGEGVEGEVVDLLVACWLAKVWVEVVNAKKKTLMDSV